MERVLRGFVFLVAFALSLHANTLKSYQIYENSVVLSFDQALSRDDFNAFYLQLKGDTNFRRVVDIKAKFLHSPQIDSVTAVPSIKIAQFTPDTTRVVLSHTKLFNISLRTEENRLIIDIDADREPKPAVVVPKEKKKLVVIDAGHGGKDTGAIGIGRVPEKEIVLKVAKMTAERLTKRGFDVIMTRDKDTYIALQDRTGLANRVKADIFVSIHANSSPLGSNFEGIETYFLSPARSERAKDVAALENSVVVENMGKFSQATFLNFLNREMVVASNKLAIDLQRGMLFSVRDKFPSVQDNGVREGPFWVLVGAQMPAVLVEIGYLSHAEEIKRLTERDYQSVIADGIALGVESYFINLSRN